MMGFLQNDEVCPSSSLSADQVGLREAATGDDSCNAKMLINQKYVSFVFVDLLAGSITGNIKFFTGTWMRLFRQK